MLIQDETGGIASEVEAPFTPILIEPTLHVFSADLVEDAQRNVYQADRSGVVYSLVLAGEVYKNLRGDSAKAKANQKLVATVAGQLAAVWDQNRAVPGVTDIIETQEATPLGTLTDVHQVAIESDSGRGEAIITVAEQQARPDIFAAIVASEVASLNAQEKAR